MPVLLRNSNFTSVSSVQFFVFMLNKSARLYRGLNVICVGLNSAAISWIMDIPVIISLHKQLHICIYVYFCVTISLILNSFYNTILSDKKVALFNLLFQIRPENQSVSLH